MSGMLAASNQMIRRPVSLMPTWLGRVAVPAHGRSENEIAFAHVAAAAVDDCGRAVGAGGEADRREGVPVQACAVARIEHGEGRYQVRGRHRLACEGR